MQLERCSRSISCVITLALRSEVLGSGYGHCDVLRAPSKHSTVPRTFRAVADAMVLVRLGDPGGPREARRYTQSTSDIARRRSQAIWTAFEGFNSHSVRQGADEILSSQIALVLG